LSFFFFLCGVGCGGFLSPVVGFLVVGAFSSGSFVGRGGFFFWLAVERAFVVCFGWVFCRVAVSLWVAMSGGVGLLCPEPCGPMWGFLSLQAG